MKDFYDLWTIIKTHEIETKQLGMVIREVFTNRKTSLKYPVAFTAEFYNNRETQKRWNTFLISMGKKQVKLEDVISELSKFTSIFFESKSNPYI